MPEEEKDILQEEFDPVYDGQRLPALKRKRLWKKYRWLFWVILMVPFVYLAVQIFIILAPQPIYETVFAGSMTDSIEVTGQVILESVTVPSIDGVPYYIVPVGQRVAAESEVAWVFEKESELEVMDKVQAIESELLLLHEAQSTVTEGGELQTHLDAMQSGIYSMINAMEKGDYGAAASPIMDTALAANKLQIATGEMQNFNDRIGQLESQKSALEASLNPRGVITVPETGYFVPTSQHDAIQRTYEDVAELSPSALQDILNTPTGYYGDDIAGHIVTDYKWSFFTVVTSKQASKFVVGSKAISLKFPDAGDITMPVTVKSVVIDEGAGLAKIELLGEYISPDILHLRAEKAEIVFGEKKGVQVPKAALRLVDIENEDGTMVTYKGVYVKFGNMVFFRKIDILIEDEFYMIVPAAITDGVNEVGMYDEVVVDTGGVELYDRKIL